MSEKRWDEPGVEKVLDGVFRIPLPLPNDGLRAVNVYAIAEDDGLVLIDGGWALAESTDQFQRALAELGYGLSDIRQFLVTHAHRDHYTGAIAIRRMLGTPVLVGLGERESIEQSVGSDAGWLRAARASLTTAGAASVLAKYLAHGQPPVADNGYELPDGWLEPGRLTLQSRSLDVVETPGHTRGHVVFHDVEAGALFAGDHVLSRITPSIGLEPATGSLPLANYLDSLRLVRARPDAILLPAHGPVTDSVHTRVEALLEHHERRLTAVADAIDQGATSTFEVAHILRWTRHDYVVDELDLFNQILAIGETRVHLDVCVVRGWLSSAIDGEGIVRFQRA